MLREVKFKLVLLFIFLFCLLFNVYAKEKGVNIYFIHSNTCSHCKEESKYLDLVEKKYNNVSIYRYEIHDNNNDSIIKEIEDKYNIIIDSVPVLIINDTIYNGFNDSSKVKILKTIDYYSKERDISLKGYINSTNYRLMGIINTNDIDDYLVEIILGFLTIFSISNIIISIILILFVLRKNSIRDRVLLLFSYFLIMIVLSINNVIYYSVSIASVIIYFLLFICIIYSLYKYLKCSIRLYLDYLIVMFIGIINKVLELFVFNKNLVILNNISKYELIIINKVGIYFNYLMSYFLFYSLLLLILFKVSKKLTNC